MKVKVSETKEITLDWLVAKCEGKNGVLHDDEITRCIVVAAPSGVYKGIWKPHFIWMQAGPIIEREMLQLTPNKEHQEVLYGLKDCQVDPGAKWLCESYAGVRQFGSTPLIAAMRCYVASRLGEEVEIPEELL